MAAADIRVSQPGLPTGHRLSISLHPQELETTITISDGRIFRLCPTRPEDNEALRKLFAELSHNEIRMRFLHAMSRVPDRQVTQFVRIDYDWEMSFVLAGAGPSNERELFGYVQIISDPDKERAEFAILVRSDLTGMGIGRVLLEHIISYARKRGIKEIYGESLLDNKAMLKLASALRFSFVDSGDPESVMMTLRL
jgi:acetyltransferase